jgi:hypothetical protein
VTAVVAKLKPRTAGGRTRDAFSYHDVRLRWCALALMAFVKRWGVYIVVAAAVVAAGASSPLHVIAGAAAWLVLPLFYAAGHGLWLAPAALMQALLGAACVWGMRSLLWPAHWAEAERALPIDRRATLVSDAAVVLAALTPLLLLYAAGAAAILANDPPWLRHHRNLALTALLAAAAASVLLGVMLLQVLRRPTRPGRRPRPLALAQRSSLAHNATLKPTHWLRALVWLPLWRAPARRTGHALLLGGVLLWLPAALIVMRGDLVGWALAGFALLALVVVTRVNSLARLEFAALVEAAVSLPLAPSALARARPGLGLLPLVPGLTVLLAALPEHGVRAPVLVAYLIALAGSAVIEVASKADVPADKSARWLFCLVLCVCLAAEVKA